MSYLNFKSKYDKYPTFKAKSGRAISGYDAVINQLREDINSDNYYLCVDAYPGCDDTLMLKALEGLNPDLLINIQDLFKNQETISEQLKYILGEDRVFAKMYYGEVSDFIDTVLLKQTQERVDAVKGLVIVYGFGASLIEGYQQLVYVDMARWEIQMRYRKGMGNYGCDNYDEDILRKYKRGYFVEWRIADKHKSNLLNKLDYLIDANKADLIKMINGKELNKALLALTKTPFRLVPYFDPGVWGGQWMKEVCNLDPDVPNYAWSFDGVPEENSLLIDFDGTVLEIPAMDLVLAQPKQLLGEKVYARFGAEFPIRFDFLDTMQGQNLSLQVHPLTEYIHKQFGMAYTQDESYYILDAKKDAHVYLGLKEGINQTMMLEELRQAQQGVKSFDAEKYINKFPAAKHDHFLIPSGTIHCSGSNAMVLEISATPYIFTFKLWDWGRVGLDGKPRPINIEHGSKVIQWDRTTEWVKENLVNATYRIDEAENPKAKIEHTGLHELEFIETTRYFFNEATIHHTLGNVNMLNLIEGEEAIVYSPNEQFEPFNVHYAETFIIPAGVDDYIIKPIGLSENHKIGIIKAEVRV